MVAFKDNLCMENTNSKVSLKRKIATTLIFAFCTVISVCVILVLVLFYRPDKNALGALGSVCMDVFSMLVLCIFVISLSIKKEGKSRTTKLFLALMLGTLYALFFDFLNWAFDGSLAYADWTYVFTICSLVCGSILAGLFCLYLSSYLDEMYGLSGAFGTAKICVICNMVSFIVTITLGLTRSAFTYVNGHYETGALYDLITVIPVLTLIFMAIYCIRNVKTIGIHDACVVVGYILTMIIGALIESIYSIGTTYVAVAIADVFIFVLLQNKLFERLKKQREQLAEKISNQYEILESMAGIYSYVNYVDLDEQTARRFDVLEDISDPIDMEGDPHTSLNKGLFGGVVNEQKESFWEFTDLSTLPKRMMNEKIITAEFRHKKDGWFRAQYIRIGESLDTPIKKVIYTIRNIDEEKKNIEKWIKKSNTDELTGYFNRHAYEEDIATLEEGRIRENFVYVSVDVNSLKLVNDTLGHDAGDEILVGACECMTQCFSAYGKLFRTGGDEFAALIFADESELTEIFKDLEELTDKWTGKLNEHLAISYGYVTWKEAEREKFSLHQMAVLADKRMYENKSRYYQERGIDRRGQRDAHVALCALYTKILKINITDDTYQIINMNADEKTKEKGFADKISSWLYEFGTSGQVHPEDLDKYLEKTTLQYISDHFRREKTSLCIFYRRKYGDEYKRVMMEMIPANDYSDKSQSLFLYVKDIEE